MNAGEKKLKIVLHIGRGTRKTRKKFRFRDLLMSVNYEVFEISSPLPDFMPDARRADAFQKSLQAGKPIIIGAFGEIHSSDSKRRSHHVLASCVLNEPNLNSSPESIGRVHENFVRMSRGVSNAAWMGCLLVSEEKLTLIHTGQMALIKVSKDPGNGMTADVDQVNRCDLDQMKVTPNAYFPQRPYFDSGFDNPPGYWVEEKHPPEGSTWLMVSRDFANLVPCEHLLKYFMLEGLSMRGQLNFYESFLYNRLRPIESYAMALISFDQNWNLENESGDNNCWLL